jgi:hypothetical protein
MHTSLHKRLEPETEWLIIMQLSMEDVILITTLETPLYTELAIGLGLYTVRRQNIKLFLPTAHISHHFRFSF